MTALVETKNQASSEVDEEIKETDLAQIDLDYDDYDQYLY